jgi:hypothetical protein
LQADDRNTLGYNAASLDNFPDALKENSVFETSETDYPLTWHYSSEAVLNHTAMKTSELVGVKVCEEGTSQN